MSLADVIRSAVSVANSVTLAAQATVTHDAWISQDSAAAPTYATGVDVKALITQGPVPFRTADGETITVRALLQFLKPIDANGAAGRFEPIDPRDRMTLPNGTVGAPILGARGAVDPSTGVPYAYEVGLG